MNTKQELDDLKKDYRRLVEINSEQELLIDCLRSERDRAVKAVDQFRWSDIWVPGLVVGATIAACKLYGVFR